MRDGSDEAHPLPEGTWIRTRVMASDSGDFNDRRAAPGSLGIVQGRDGDGKYEILFWPSQVLNRWSQDDIVADAQVLPAGHPDIPPPAALELVRAVADILAQGESTGSEVTAPAEVAVRIRAAATAAGAGAKAIRAIVPEAAETDGLELDAEGYNRLARIAGVGDRLQPGSFPGP